MYSCCIVGVIIKEKNGVMINCLAFLPVNAFKETSPFFMKELSSPTHKFFKMLSLKRTIFLRFLVTTLLKVDCILPKGALG